MNTSYCFNRSSLRGLFGIVLFLLSSMSLSAAIIHYVPDGSSSQKIAAQQPANGNEWNAVGQSFTAEDPLVKFGFYMFSQVQGSFEILFSLYGGSGISGAPLSQKTVWADLVGFSTGDFLVEVDLTGVPLSVGSIYTVAVSLPGMALPPLGTQSNTGIKYASTSSSVYEGGRFWYGGNTYPPHLFAQRDIAFKVTPVALEVPDASSTLTLGAFAFVCLVGIRRRFRR